MSGVKIDELIDGIAHAAFNTGDMKKSLDFYCRVLGFTRAFTLKKEDGAPKIEYIRAGKAHFFELFYDSPESPPVPAASFNHVCLSVGDILAVEKRLDSLNWPVDVRPRKGMDGNWQMWTHDPDGNRLELMQLDPESLQSKALRS
jgi:lactoylglutathione lyase